MPQTTVSRPLSPPVARSKAERTSPLRFVLPPHVIDLAARQVRLCSLTLGVVWP